MSLYPDTNPPELWNSSDAPWKEDPREAFPDDPQGEEEEDVNLLFQRYSHDRRLGGASPTVDGGPVQKTHRANLTPASYHNNTVDPTIEWELEDALQGLGDLLK